MEAQSRPFLQTHSSASRDFHCAMQLLGTQPSAPVSLCFAYHQSPSSVLMMQRRSPFLKVRSSSVRESQSNFAMNVGRFGSGGGGRLDGAATTVWSSSSPCLGLLLSPLQAQLPMLRQATPLLLLQSYRSLGPAHVGVYAINTTRIAPFALSLPANSPRNGFYPLSTFH